MDDLKSIQAVLENLRNDLLSAKNLIDGSPEVKTSRRLQGAITRCSDLIHAISVNRAKNEPQLAPETPPQEEVSNG